MANRSRQLSIAVLQSSTSGRSNSGACNRLNSPTCPPLAALKRRTLSQYEARFPGYGHLMRLALNEAEGAALQTGFPGLFYPALASEKVDALASWILHQQAIRQISETALSA